LLVWIHLQGLLSHTILKFSVWYLESFRLGCFFNGIGLQAWFFNR
jgi:hypothetical protein